MNMNLQDGVALAKEINEALVADKPNCGVIICTPFIHLASVAQQIEIIGDISHHHPGDNNQRTSQCVGEKANPCELDAIAVSHDWPAFKNKMA